jgi:methionyl aminopeptidase
MREAGRIVARVLALMTEAAEPGVTTAHLDRLAEETIRAAGAKPSFKGYRGYPATICVEPDDVVVHGIPDDRVTLQAGQVLGIDVGAEYEGYHGDGAVTLAIGDISAEKQALLEATEQALHLGISAARAGNRLRDICGSIQQYVEGRGYSVVRALVGHGIGRSMHEPVQVPNFVDEDEFTECSLLLRPGFTFAIEPMVNMGTYEVTQDEDNWTVRTADGRPSAHFEHTVAITKDGPVILTLL